MENLLTAALFPKSAIASADARKWLPRRPRRGMDAGSSLGPPRVLPRRPRRGGAVNEAPSVSEPWCQLSGVGMDAGGSLGRLQFLSLGDNFLGLEWMRVARWVAFSF